MSKLQTILKREIDKIADKLTSEVEIALMGRIEHVRAAIKILSDKHFHTSYILDNDQKKQGLSVDGTTILSPTQALLPYKDNMRIFIYSPKYWDEMLDQCKKAGYEEGQHIFVLDKPSEDKNRKMAIEGIDIYRALQSKYGYDCIFMLVNCPMGDFYLIGLFIKKYLRLNGISKYVFIGTSKGIEKLSGLFLFPVGEPIDIETANKLITAWKLFGSILVNIKILTIWQGDFKFNSSLLRQDERFTFTDTFRHMIFGLKEKEEPEYPIRNDDQSNADYIMKSNDLICGKTVILNPFAYSLQSLPDVFWIHLAEKLKILGYMVAVNIGEEREHNFIPNTASLSVPYSEMDAVLEKAGTVIGMRSGFFDITSQAACRRVILYPPETGEKVQWNSTDMKFCSLKNMGLCDDAIELSVSDQDAVINRILEVLQ